MDIRRYCKVIGAIFLAVGILGFFPGVSHSPSHSMEPSTTGMLFGLFPINGLHNLIHIAFGIWALTAAKSFDTARVFCMANAVIYAVFAVFGLIPGLQNLFGLVPLHGHDVWLHALIALSSAYFAWGWSDRTTLKMGT